MQNHSLWRTYLTNARPHQLYAYGAALGDQKPIINFAWPYHQAIGTMAVELFRATQARNPKSPASALLLSNCAGGVIDIECIHLDNVLVVNPPRPVMHLAAFAAYTATSILLCLWCSCSVEKSLINNQKVPDFSANSFVFCSKVYIKFTPAYTNNKP